MESLNDKMKKLFGDDVFALEEGKLAERAVRSEKTIPIERMETVSRVLDSEIRRIGETLDSERERAKTYTTIATLATAAAVGFGVYEFVPVFEPLRNIAREIIGTTVDVANRQDFQNLPEHIKQHNIPQYVQNSAEEFARFIQGGLAALCSFALQPVYEAVFSGKDSPDINNLRVYRAIRSKIGNVLEARYRTDLDNF